MNIVIFGAGNRASDLASARYLEPVPGLDIAPGYGLGHGDIALAWQGIA